MNKNDNMKEIFGGGVLLKADFHPPPCLRKKRWKAFEQAEGRMKSWVNS